MPEAPDWINPANDRKTPYTDEEHDLFVDDFIEGFGDEWEDLKLKLGNLWLDKKLRTGS